MPVAFYRVEKEEDLYYLGLSLMNATSLPIDLSKQFEQKRNGHSAKWNTKQHVLQVDCRHFSAPGMTFGRMTSHIGLAHRLSGESRIACREVKREITFYVCQG